MYTHIHMCMHLYCICMVFVTVDMLSSGLVPVVGELSTEDPHIVGYVSDTTTLPCEHTVPKSDLEAVVWRKDTETIVAEYDIGDDPPGSFYDSMAGRASAKVFPPTLKFSSGSLEDAGVYQCEVFPLKGNAIIHRYTVTVNGRELLYLETLQCPLPCTQCINESDHMSSISVCPRDILGLVKC